MVEGHKAQRVDIVFLGNVGDSALCVFDMIDGVIWAAVNSRMPERAVAHIREHARRGFDGPMVCSVDCEVR